MTILNSLPLQKQTQSAIVDNTITSHITNDPSSLKITKPVFKEFSIAFKNFTVATLCNCFRAINNAIR